MVKLPILTTICLVFSVAIFIVPPMAIAERIEGQAAEKIVKNGEIIAGGIDSIAKYAVLVKYKRKLYNCFLVFNDAGLQVRFCWSE